MRGRLSAQRCRGCAPGLALGVMQAEGLAEPEAGSRKHSLAQGGRGLEPRNKARGWF